MLVDVIGTHFKCQFWSFLTILLAFSANAATPAADHCLGDFQRVSLSRDRVIRVLAKEKDYTQGLLFSDGALYESTGLYGQSKLRRIDPVSSMPTTVRTLDKRFFAEGITKVDQEIFQATFKDNTLFEYAAGKPDQVSRLDGEAWGLATYNEQLVVSDGSATLRFVDPTSLKRIREIKVHRGRAIFKNLNELEVVRGRILANLFGSDWIAVINPRNGCLEGSIDLSALRTGPTQDPQEAKCESATCTPADFATNGIAYDAETDELYLTGKNWPYIFVFKFPPELLHVKKTESI